MAAGFSTGPKRESIVMLGSEHDVFDACAKEQVSPQSGIKQLGCKTWCKVLINEISSVNLLVKLTPYISGV